MYACLGVLLLSTCRAPASDPAPPEARPLQRGVVVCEHPLAAEVGADVLRRGGNAADAAIATALALAVCYPQAGNLGGGGFALWVPRRGEARALDFRERAPAGFRPESLNDASGQPSPAGLQSGPFSAGVPGTPYGLWAFFRAHASGRFDFYALARPAIALARDGFAVDAVLASDLAKESARAKLSRSPAALERFYPGGEALREGQLLVQSELADTLVILARAGPDGFYSGPVAEKLVDELRQSALREGRIGFENGGVEVLRGAITLEDLANYRSSWREPLRGWFRGREVISMPPPSSGGIVLLQTLAVLDGFPLDAAAARHRANLAREGGQLTLAEGGGIDERIVHWWTEALRRAFAERALHLGDPDYVDVPVDQLLAADWVADCRIDIGERAASEFEPRPLPPEGADTTHLSVVDVEGNAVSLTTTLNSRFGSGLYVADGGFLLNNENDDFSLGMGLPNQYGLVGGAANAIEPGKRPLSSMTPTVLRDGSGDVRLVVGSPGGPRIITAVIGVVLRTQVFGQSLSDAVAAPRFHQQWSPASTEFEPGWPAELLDALRRRGHDVRAMEGRWASVQAIQVLQDGRVLGSSDPRRGGAVKGS